MVVNNKLERVRKEVTVPWFLALARYLPGRTHKNCKKPQSAQQVWDLRLVIFETQIRTAQRPLRWVRRNHGASDARKVLNPGILFDELSHWFEGRSTRKNPCGGDDDNNNNNNNKKKKKKKKKNGTVISRNTDYAMRTRDSFPSAKRPRREAHFP
jgi:hypothetical protein